MGRKPTITCEGLIELAEEIVRGEGAAGLTIDALAKRAGISKGGVQYSFSSKDDLIRALIERWTHQFDALLGAMDDVPPADLVRKYIHVMRGSQAAMNAKMAGLMIAYIQNRKTSRKPVSGTVPCSSVWAAQQKTHRRRVSRCLQ